MDLLRLAGSPGAGKSAVGWAAAELLAAQGDPVAYLDIDQLDMCYPPSDADPDRWTLKERALRVIAEQHQRSGVTRLVVSGVAMPDLPCEPDPGRFAPRHLISGASPAASLNLLYPLRGIGR